MRESVWAWLSVPGVSMQREVIIDEACTHTHRDILGYYPTISRGIIRPDLLLWIQNITVLGPDYSPRFCVCCAGESPMMAALTSEIPSNLSRLIFLLPPVLVVYTPNLCLPSRTSSRLLSLLVSFPLVRLDGREGGAEGDSPPLWSTSSSLARVDVAARVGGGKSCSPENLWKAAMYGANDLRVTAPEPASFRSWWNIARLV